MHIRIIVASLAIAALFGGALKAQQGYTADDIPRIDVISPLSEYLARPEDEKIPFYPFQRCAGLFLGLKYHAGSTMTPEQLAATEQNTEMMRISAIILELNRAAQQRGHSIDDLPDEMIQTIPGQSAVRMQSFAFFYSERMQDNYLTDGTAFNEDRLISDDLTICQELAPTAAEIVDGFG